MNAPLTSTETEALEAGKMRLMGQLLGSVIHEVNNPLAIGMGRMQQLKTLVDLTNPDIQKMTGSITLQFERMRDILVAAKRLAVFGNNQVLETVTTKSLISSIEVLLAERCRRHGVTFVFDEPESTWQVESSVDGLVSLLVAMLLEAIEFLKSQKADERPPINIQFIKGSIVLSWPFQRAFVCNEYTAALIAKLGLKSLESQDSNGSSFRCALTFRA